MPAGFGVPNGNVNMHCVDGYVIFRYVNDILDALPSKIKHRLLELLQLLGFHGWEMVIGKINE